MMTRFPREASQFCALEILKILIKNQFHERIGNITVMDLGSFREDVR